MYTDTNTFEHINIIIKKVMKPQHIAAKLLFDTRRSCHVRKEAHIHTQQWFASAHAVTDQHRAEDY